MSIRPLDLQVNINSLNELSRVEGEKLARDASVKRHTDEQIVKDNILRESRVERSGETEIKSNIKQHADHFGNLNDEEIDTEEFSHRQHQPDRQQAKDSPHDSKSEQEEDKKKSQDDHHIDIFA